MFSFLIYSLCSRFFGLFCACVMKIIFFCCTVNYWNHLTDAVGPFGCKSLSTRRVVSCKSLSTFIRKFDEFVTAKGKISIYCSSGNVYHSRFYFHFLCLNEFMTANGEIQIYCTLVNGYHSRFYLHFLCLNEFMTAKGEIQIYIVV